MYVGHQDKNNYLINDIFVTIFWENKDKCETNEGKISIQRKDIIIT